MGERAFVSRPSESVADAISQWLNPGTWVRVDNDEPLDRRHVEAIARHVVESLYRDGFKIGRKP